MAPWRPKYLLNRLEHYIVIILIKDLLISSVIDIQTQEITRLNGIYKRLLSNAGVTMFEGEGKLIDAHLVEVTQADGTTKQYSAKHILIATGSRAQRVNIPGEVCLVISLFLTKL